MLYHIGDCVLLKLNVKGSYDIIVYDNMNHLKWSAISILGTYVNNVDMITESDKYMWLL